MYYYVNSQAISATYMWLIEAGGSTSEIFILQWYGMNSNPADKPKASLVLDENKF